MILCIGVLCVAVLVPVVGRKKVSSEVRRAAVVMILVSALAILGHSFIGGDSFCMRASV